MTGENIRMHALALLRALPEESRLALSAQVVERFFFIFDKVLKLQMKKKSVLDLVFGLYWPVSFEVDLRLLFPMVSKRGYLSCFPKVVSEKKLQFVAIDETSVWGRGPYGIQEPMTFLRKIEPEEVDVCIVPGLAFGKQGERIGRGGGYYDRFFASSLGCVRIGLAFDMQVFDVLPQTKTDQKVHWVITESQEFFR